MLQEAGLPVQFWAEAVNTAVYLTNSSPSLAVKKMTPEEAWTGQKTDSMHLEVFGCKAYFHIPNQKRTKWDSKSKETVFVGYCEESKGYRLIDPKTLEFHRDMMLYFLKTKWITILQNQRQKTETVTLSLSNDNTYKETLQHRESFQREQESRNERNKK